MNELNAAGVVMQPGYVTNTQTYVSLASSNYTLPFNPKRRRLLLQCRGTSPVEFTLDGSTPVTGQCHTLAVGAMYEMSYRYDNLPTGAIVFLAASGAGIVITEGV